MEYQLADSIFNLIAPEIIKENIPTSVLIDFAISSSINNRRLRKPNIKLLDQILNKYSFTTEEQVELLIEKSACLRDMLQNNYALSCLEYAARIKQSNPKTTCNLHFSTGVLQIREEKFKQAAFHLEKATEICAKIKIPICRYIYSLSEQEKIINYNQRKSFTNELTEVYSPWIDKYTNTTNAYITTNKDSAIYYLKKNTKSDGIGQCQEDPTDLKYLIDTYIDIGECEIAERLLNNHITCHQQKNTNIDYRLYNSLSRLQSQKYLKKNNITNLEKSIEYNYKELEASKKQLSKSDNLHFSDLRLENLINLLEILQIKKNLLNDKKKIKLLNNRLSEYKSYTLNLTSNTYNTFSQRGKSELHEYLHLSSEIDSLTILASQEKFQSDIYKKIYLAEQKLYNLTQTTTSSAQKLTSTAEKHKSSIANNLTKSTSKYTIEIIRGHEEYYFVEFNFNDIEIKSINADVIDKEVKKLIHLVSSKESLESINKSSQKLKNILNINLNIDKILIIPEGKLSDLPFELLLNIKNENQIHYSSTHNDSFLTESISPNKVTLFTYTDKNTINTSSKLKYSELPHSLHEANSISKIYQNHHVFSGGEMTDIKILQNLNSNILHISTHSFSNPENILGNYLIVRDEKGNPEKMYGYQIKNTICTADLVILSSCNSGTGAYKPGAGTFSLSRDFLAAGAKSVIKSLWNVNEASTAELMISFHTYFQNHSVSEALTLAKRDMANSDNYSHPYYWAGFVLEGNPNIYLKK